MLKYLIIVIAWQFHALCFGNTFEQELRIDDNGDLENSSTVPRCSPGQKIELLSYKYQKRCSGNTCDITYKGSLSPDAELLLQEMCSLQEVCSNLRFPFRSDLQRNQSDAVSLKYRCLDSSTFIDICDDTKVPLDTTFHITSSRKATAYKMCNCSIMNGEFSVEQREIRLKVKNESSCSPAVVIFEGPRISSLACNESREDFGVINNASFSKSAFNVMISLILNSNDTLPDMVWITVKPQKGTATLTCQPILRPSYGTAQDVSAPPVISNKNHSAFASIWFVPLMTGIAVAFVMLLACLIFIMIYKRRQEKDERTDTVIRDQPQTLPPTEHSGRETKQEKMSQKDNSSQIPKSAVAGLKKSTANDNFYFEINIYDADSEYSNKTSVDKQAIQANRAVDNPYYGEEEYDTGTLSKKKPKRNPQYDHVDSVKHPEIASVSNIQLKRVHVNKSSFKLQC